MSSCCVGLPKWWLLRFAKAVKRLPRSCYFVMSLSSIRSLGHDLLIRREPPLYLFQNLNFDLNPVILSTLLAQGFRHTNADYMLFLFDYLTRNDVQLNSFLINKISSSLDNQKKKILDYVRLGLWKLLGHLSNEKLLSIFSDNIYFQFKIKEISII